MKKILSEILVISLLGASGLLAQEGEYKTATVVRTDLTGIGEEKGVMRRDPSDIIKIGDLFYVWYSKGPISPGYDATIWYATSENGIDWNEKGEAVGKGEEGSWEGASVFTPNILTAEGKYYLFYTGTSKPFYKKPFNPDSKIGVAVADSPDGPWVKNEEGNPVISNSDNPKDFDSHLIDDACLIVRDEQYWLYYKGRQLGKAPSDTQMGVAIAERPEGPYTKYGENPVIPGNHEVVIWPQGTGVTAMIGTTGPKDIINSILHSEDGYTFKKVQNIVGHPWAAGTYRPEAFTDSDEGDKPTWGVEIGKGKRKSLPFIRRFDVKWPEE